MIRRRLAATNSSNPLIQQRLESMGIKRLMTLRLLKGQTVYVTCSTAVFCLFFCKVPAKLFMGFTGTMRLKAAAMLLSQNSMALS
jgi:hypothetical protein